MENRSSSPTCIEDRGQHASTHLTSSSLFNNIRSKLGSVVDPEWFGPNTDPAFQVIQDPDPDPDWQISVHQRTAAFFRFSKYRT